MLIFSELLVEQVDLLFEVPGKRRVRHGHEEKVAAEERTPTRRLRLRREQRGLPDVQPWHVWGWLGSEVPARIGSALCHTTIGQALLIGQK